MKINNQSTFFIINTLILLPILYLCFFNYPSADDFSYGVALKNNTFWEVQMMRYNDWTSRYFATATLSSSPLVFGTIKYFGLYSFLFIVLNICAGIYTLKALQVNDSKLRVLISLSFISVFALLCTSLSENFFWLAGSVTYYLPSIMFLFLIGALLNLYQRHSVKDFLISIVSIFIIGGCTEVLVGYSLMLVSGFLAFDYYKNKRIKKEYLFNLFFLFVIVAFILLSPGNKVRENNIQNIPLFEILYLSLKKAIVINARYSIFAFIFFLVINSLLKIKIFNKISFSKMFILFLGMNLVLFIGCFVSVYGVQGNFPPRVESMLIFIQFIFLFILSNVVIQTNLFKNKVIPILGIFTFLIYFSIPKNEYQRENNLSLIYSDIFTGKVTQFRQDQIARDNYLRDCGDSCVIERFKDPPYSILFKDIRIDDNHYINISIKKFYDKNSIKVK